jgi:hypothetical protein
MCMCMSMCMCMYEYEYVYVYVYVYVCTYAQLLDGVLAPEVHRQPGERERTRLERGFNR